MVGTWIAVIAGSVIFIIGALWLFNTAFGESTSCGLLCMFVPFYAVYYAITRWEDTKKPFVVGLIGLVFLIAGLSAFL